MLVSRRNLRRNGVPPECPFQKGAATQPPISADVTSGANTHYAQWFSPTDSAAWAAKTAVWFLDVSEGVHFAAVRF